jgi:hypothetical protein
VAAQTPELGPVTALEAAARQKTTDWEKLAQDMESSVARLLPCDAKAAATITAVNQASDARQTAMAAYLRAAQQQASQETAAARRVLASAQSLASELVTEKSDVAQEQAGIEAQLANLEESVKSRAVLGDALKILQQIQMLAGLRASLSQGVVDNQEAFLAPVRDLVASLEQRESAMKDAAAAYETERSRWNAYYAARLARAQTECSIIRGPAPAPAAPPPPRGKQK